jgi:hypothetical protein
LDHGELHLDPLPLVGAHFAPVDPELAGNGRLRRCVESAAGLLPALEQVDDQLLIIMRAFILHGSVSARRKS